MPVIKQGSVVLSDHLEFSVRLALSQLVLLADPPFVYLHYVAPQSVFVVDAIVTRPAPKLAIEQLRQIGYLYPGIIPCFEHHLVVDLVKEPGNVHINHPILLIAALAIDPGSFASPPNLP